MFYKDQINLMRSKIRDLFINNRNLSSRDLNYQSLKWPNSCSINQIDFWIKDLVIDNAGKLVHLKFINDDIIPNKKHL